MPTTRTSRAAPAFAGSSRYGVVSEIGVGGSGVVYEVVDRELGARLALKTLRRGSAAELLQLKREFRSLQGLRHANLVQLGELVEEDGRWFFTMELIDGDSFLDHVCGPAVDRQRPEPDIDALRRCVRQLAEGVAFLHEAGKLHRDIKPSNVLVDRSPGGERVVILDFGLVSEIGLGEPGSISGTPAYMSPEQLAGGEVGPASDWYAVGVMIYEALAGALPFAGSFADIRDAKGRGPVGPPSASREVAAPELEALCLALMAPDPADRPADREILGRLGIGRGRTRPSSPILVGRADELAALERGFARVRDGGRAEVVLVVGESGIGKSTLVRELVNRAGGRDRAITLASRCNERESVPFKAVDGLIDSMIPHLIALDPPPPPPDEAADLIATFPVLSEVSWLDPGGEPEPGGDADARERRTRVFAGVRALLAALARERPILCAVDDLQWTDADSLSLLAGALQPPGEPRVFLVATMRSDIATHENVTEPEEVIAALPLAAERVELGPLPEADCRALIAAIAGRTGAGDAVDIEAAVRETSGHPMFAVELMRHSHRRDGEPISLQQVIGARIDEASPTARVLLELVCTAEAPLTQSVLAAALEASGDRFRSALDELAAASFVTRTGSRRADRVEPYHDQIKQAALDKVEVARLPDLHRRLATALERSLDASPELLAAHWRAAGEPERAAEFALAAADKASTALAFELAASYFARALEWGELAGAEGDRVRHRMAEALANAGFGGRAAELFEELAAVDGIDGDERLRRLHRAVQQYLVVGQVEPAMALLDGLARELGIPIPGGPRRLLVALLWRRTKLRLRGLAPRHGDFEQSERDRLRMDLCWDVASGLGVIDTLKASYFQTVNLGFALDRGDPERLARAIIAEALYAASLGSRGRLDSLIERADEIASDLADEDGEIFKLLLDGAALTAIGDWAPALELLERGGAMLRERPRVLADHAISPTFLHDIANTVINAPLYYRAKLSTIAARTPVLLADARLRRDVQAIPHYLIGVTTAVWLGRLGPEVAGAYLDEAMEPWGSGRGQFPHFMAAQSRCYLDLWRGEPGAAVEQVAAVMPELGRSYLLRVQYVRVSMLELEGRTAAAAAAAASTGRTRERMLATARRAAARLDRERAPWAATLGAAVRASIALATGAGGAAALERLASLAGESGMLLHQRLARIALARHRGRELDAGDESWLVDNVAAGVDRWRWLRAMLANL